MNNIQAIVEHLNLSSLASFKGNLALCADTPENSDKLIEKRNPIYRTSGGKILFGYDQPISGMIFQKIEKNEATSWFNRLEENQEMSPDGDDGSACEVCEVSSDDWQRLRDIVNGEPIQRDETTDWLTKAGLVEYSGGSTPRATALGRKWVGMDR